MTVGSVNVTGVEGAKINVYTKIENNVNREGVVAITKQAIENIISTNANFARENNSYTYLANIPKYHSGYAVCGSVGEYIYIFDGIIASNDRRAYKYSVADNTYTTIATPPFDIQSQTTCAFGTDIYFFGGANDSMQDKVYKYNTISNTYSLVSTTIPFQHYKGSAIAKGKYIYLFGSGVRENTKIAYRYTPNSNSWYKLPDTPVEFTCGGIASIGSKIYLIGGSYQSKGIIYNIDTNTYNTEVLDVPYRLVYGNAMAVGTNIYMFGTNNSDYNYRTAYKYDTLNNTFTSLSYAPHDLMRSGLVKVNNNIYIVGGTGNTTTGVKMMRFGFTTSTYTENSLVFIRSNDRSGLFYTELSTPKIKMAGFNTRLCTPFDYFFLYRNGQILEPESYIGTGSQWAVFN